MPPARSTARSHPAPRRAAPRPGDAARSRSSESRAGFQPRHVRSRMPLSRIRWDRASRVTMLAALALVAYLWIDGLSSLMGTHAQAEHGLAQVRALAAENHKLISEQKALGQLPTVLQDARKLGMVQQGEQAYVVTH